MVYRGVIWLVAWMVVSVIAGALLYPIMPPPFTDCLSDPMAWTREASSLHCLSDPIGIRAMFDTAYKAGFMTLQTGALIAAGFWGLVLGSVAIMAIFLVVKRASGLRRKGVGKPHVSK